MKNIFYTISIFLLVMSHLSLRTQNIGINTDGSDPDNSAMLDIKSADKGILIPRMTEAQKNLINSPAVGLMIFQTDGVSGFWYYDGSAWTQSVGADGATGATGLLTPGTVPGSIPYWDGNEWVVSSPNFFNDGGSLGIGTNNPEASAIVDMSSTTQGALLPRMTTAERDAISNPAAGLLIYNLDCHTFDYFNGISWGAINPIVASISISADPVGAICNGTNVVFTAASYNGGVAGTYQWKVNGIDVGTNSNTYSSSTLLNGDQISCELNSNSNCVSVNPVVSNILSMVVSLPPTLADAGSDINLCNTTLTTLSANTPIIGTGSWSVVSGTATITDPSSPTSGVTGLTIPGTATLRWTISNSPCIPSTDDVVITVYELPTPANAGDDQLLCNVTTTTLSANTPLVGTGIWSVVSGTAVIANPSSPTSSVSGLVAGTARLRWSISNFPCSASTDDVYITVSGLPTVADAGSDKLLCNTTTTTLSANAPSVGSGMWSVVSGDAIITTPTSRTSGVTGLTIPGTAVLRWTISNSPCSASEDDMVITVVEPPTSANAGDDQLLCNVTTTTLSANAPSVGTGMWSVVSGTATITTPSSRTSGVTGLTIPGTAVLRWTISNSPCSASEDDMEITVSSSFEPPTAANAGNDQTIFNSTTTLAANTPVVGTGTWSVISGSASISDPSSPTSAVTLSTISSVTLRWTISNPPCDNVSIDDVVITWFMWEW